jgi:hypothetical protein
MPKKLAKGLTTLVHNPLKLAVFSIDEEQK